MAVVVGVVVVEVEGVVVAIVVVVAVAVVVVEVEGVVVSIVVVVVVVVIGILVSSTKHLQIRILLFCLTHSPYGYQLTRQKNKHALTCKSSVLSQISW